jgi:hypothetical protein
MLPIMAASEPAIDKGGGWSLTKSLPVDHFGTGVMPMERQVVLTVQPTMGRALQFSCSPEQARQLADKLELSASECIEGGHA